MAVLEGKASIVAGSQTRADAARRVVTKIVNALTARLEVGGPMVCTDLLGFPNHCTNKLFKPLYWYSYDQFARRSCDEDAEDDHKDLIGVLAASRSVIAACMIILTGRASSSGCLCTSTYSVPTLSN